MGIKHKRKKELQKRLGIITETYTKLKGKSNRKKLCDFIEQKMAEILSFSDSLPVKMEIQKKEISETSGITKSKVVVFQPSPTLAEELRKITNYKQDIKNAAADQ